MMADFLQTLDWFLCPQPHSADAGLSRSWTFPVSAEPISTRLWLATAVYFPCESPCFIQFSYSQDGLLPLIHCYILFCSRRPYRLVLFFFLFCHLVELQEVVEMNTCVECAMFHQPSISLHTLWGYCQYQTGQSVQKCFANSKMSSKCDLLSLGS